MPEQLISSSGIQYGLIINPDGSINVSGNVNAVISGNITIGSVSASVDSVFIQSGNNLNLGSTWKGTGSVYNTNLGSQTWIKGGSITTYGIGSITPIDRTDTSFKFEYIISGTSNGVTGSSVGSIIKFEGAGSFVQVFTWSNDLVTNIGSWV